MPQSMGSFEVYCDECVLCSFLDPFAFEARASETRLTLNQEVTWQMRKYQRSDRADVPGKTGCRRAVSRARSAGAVVRAREARSRPSRLPATKGRPMLRSNLTSFSAASRLAGLPHRRR